MPGEQFSGRLFSGLGLRLAPRRAMESAGSTYSSRRFRCGEGVRPESRPRDTYAPKSLGVVICETTCLGPVVRPTHSERCPPTSLPIRVAAARALREHRLLRPYDSAVDCADMPIHVAARLTRGASRAPRQITLSVCPAPERSMR
jgi:hypothetical protein